MSCACQTASREEETFVVRVALSDRELLELRDDLEWGEKVFGQPELRSLAESLGVRLWHTVAKRALEGAGRLRK